MIDSIDIYRYVIDRYYVICCAEKVLSMHQVPSTKFPTHGASHTGPKKKGRGAEDATPAPRRSRNQGQ